MGEFVIDVQGLSRDYGDKVVLSELDLQVESGIVYGLLGENGTGKTTLIRHLLGRLCPQRGDVRMFGMNPIVDPAEVLGRIGYLSEARDMPRWMNVDEFIRYMQPFYPLWDERFAAELKDMFALPSKTLLSDLSRGQLARVGLLVAVAHRPPLLLLDEPSAGLDAVVRRDILAEIIRAVTEQGRTVFLSSHLLGEMEQVADRVGILRNGRIAIEGNVSELLKSYRRFTVRFSEVVHEFPTNIDAVAKRSEENEWGVVVFNSDRETLRQQLTVHGGEIVDEPTMSLEDLFVATSTAKETAEESSKETVEETPQ